MEPFAFDEYRKKKIREKIEEDRTNRVQLNKLPKVNKELALKYMEAELDTTKKKKKKPETNISTDDRFKSIFEDTNFQIDQNADEYRLLNPVLTRLDKNKEKQLKKKLEQFEEIDDELDGKNSSDESSSDENDDESSDDDHTWTKDVKKQHRIIQREHKQREWDERKAAEEAEEAAEMEKQPKFFEIKNGEEFTGIKSMRKKSNKAALGERLKTEDVSKVKLLGSVGSREMSFSTNRKKVHEQNKRHQMERKQLIRPASGIIKKKFGFKNRRR